MSGRAPEHGSLGPRSVQKEEMMSTRRRIRTAAPAIASLAALTLLAGCAAQKSAPEAWWGDPESGVVLRYHMPAGKTLTYEISSETDQEMEVMGNTTDVSTEQTLRFGLVPEPPKNGGQRLKITVDDLSMTIVSQQGTISPPTDAVRGMSFEMGVSEMGTEEDCEAAAELRYSIMQEERDLSTDFCAFFPDLPEAPVKVGDMWESRALVEPVAGGGGTSVNILSLNTLAGFETVDGHECARIENEFTGTIEGSGSQGPATFTVTGSLEGSGTWHFAYKEGLVVDDFSVGTGDGEVLVDGPQKMTIPTTREFTMETRLVAAGEDDAASRPEKRPAKQSAEPFTEVPARTADAPPKITTAGPFTVVGVRQRFESVNEAASADYEGLWTNEFMPHHEVLLPLSTDKFYYGVSYGTGEGESFYYLAGMAVDDDAPTPDGLTRYQVPLATYAVFETTMDGIGETWNRVFSKWLPASGYEYAWEAPSYEEYPPDTDDASTVLLYVPVMKVK